VSNSDDTGGMSSNGRQDLSIVGCAGFDCTQRYVCIDKYKRCTDNWCTVNCNHGAAFCPKSYCRQSFHTVVTVDQPQVYESNIRAA
jgi:hypothetical protein